MQAQEHYHIHIYEDLSYTWLIIYLKRAEKGGVIGDVGYYTTPQPTTN